MKTTYLFKEETTNGQKKLRIGTAQEFAKIAEQNRTLPIEERRYFIKEKSLDSDSPDYLFIEVDRDEYNQWNRENNARYKNTAAGQTYTMVSLETVMNAVAHGKVEEAALYDHDAGYEECLAEILLEELCEELRNWKPWAMDMLQIYMKNGAEICAVKFANRYAVGESTARRYVRQFEQKIKKFLEG